MYGSCPRRSSQLPGSMLMLCAPGSRCGRPPSSRLQNPAVLRSATWAFEDTPRPLEDCLGLRAFEGLSSWWGLPGECSLAPRASWVRNSGTATSSTSTRLLGRTWSRHQLMESTSGVQDHWSPRKVQGSFMSSLREPFRRAREAFENFYLVGRCPHLVCTEESQSCWAVAAL